MERDVIIAAFLVILLGELLVKVLLWHRLIMLSKNLEIVSRLWVLRRFLCIMVGLLLIRRRFLEGRCFICFLRQFVIGTLVFFLI